MSSLSVSKVDYRRWKSLSQNLGRFLVFVSQIMFSQLSSLIGQGSANPAMDLFLWGSHRSHRRSWDLLDEWEKEPDLSPARFQDKIGRNKDIQWKLTWRPVWGFLFVCLFWVWVIPYIRITLCIFKELLYILPRQALPITWRGWEDRSFCLHSLGEKTKLRVDPWQAMWSGRCGS